MNVVLVQLRIQPGGCADNLERATDAVRQAAKRGADLVVLPELFTVGYFAFDSYARSAESVCGPTLSRLGALAGEQSVAILAGSVIEDLSASTADGVETPAESGYANTSVFFDDSGRRCGVYRKHHLFGYDSPEAELLTPGETIQTVEYEGFTVGMTTCYDLRFPELYRNLVEAGATLVLVPSAWPYPRLEHWRLLPRARAVENLFYVAAVNGVGDFEQASLLGRSAVYDPWGTAVAGTGDDPGFVTATLDPEAVERRREEFPVLEDRGQLRR